MSYPIFTFLLALGATGIAFKAFWFLRFRTMPNWVLAVGAVSFLLMLAGLAGAISTLDMQVATTGMRG